jgi:hypothetical protein
MSIAECRRCAPAMSAAIQHQLRYTGRTLLNLNHGPSPSLNAAPVRVAIAVMGSAKHVDIHALATETANDGVYFHRAVLPGSVEVVADDAPLKTQGLRCCRRDFTSQIRDRWTASRMD